MAPDSARSRHGLCEERRDPHAGGARPIPAQSPSAASSWHDTDSASAARRYGRRMNVGACSSFLYRRRTFDEDELPVQRPLPQLERLLGDLRAGRAELLYARKLLRDRAAECRAWSARGCAHAYSDYRRHRFVGRRDDGSRGGDDVGRARPDRVRAGRSDPWRRGAARPRGERDSGPHRCRRCRDAACRRGSLAGPVDDAARGTGAPAHRGGPRRRSASPARCPTAAARPRCFGPRRCRGSTARRQPRPPPSRSPAQATC